MNNRRLPTLRTTGQWILVPLLMAAFSVYAAPFNLNVGNGMGGGSYEPSSTVTIWANPYEGTDPDIASDEPADPNAPVRVFDSWTGDTHVLSDPNASQTTLVMPSADINITAQYKDAPRWISPRVQYYVPEAHDGIIFMFHGRNGCGECMFDKGDTRDMVNDAISRGYAVVALDSFDRVNREWNLDPSAATNVDMQRVNALRNNLISRGKISATEPVYLLGVSNGGMFASLLSQQALPAFGFDVAAQALYVAPGHLETMAVTQTPTIFALAENDTTIDNSRAISNFGGLLARDIPTRLITNHPSPVHMNRFWGIEGLSSNDSQAIHAKLVLAGYLDGSNYILEHALLDDNGDGIPDWQTSIPEEYANQMGSIESELKDAFAEHQFYSHANNVTLGFFADPVTVIDLQPQVSEIAPLIGVEGTVVTITGSNLVGITTVMFNGVAAEFQAVNETKMFATVPPGATSGTIVVSNSSDSSESPVAFEVLHAPTIVSFEPTSGPVGTEVIVTGTDLSTTSIVRFGNADATFVVDSDTQVRATIPQGAVTGKWGLMTGGGIAIAPDRFRVR